MENNDSKSIDGSEMEDGKVRSVDIVIPVYRNLDVSRRCIESVLENLTESIATVIVIDDASPDADLVSYCDNLASAGKVVLLRNDHNLGFVATANRGMQSNLDNDVLLLNSDTEVSGDWLERLRKCAYADEATGTVTPFSNNATLSSYPLFMKPNKLPNGWKLDVLDKLFAESNKDMRQQIPTAVGFCMYIRRDCMDRIGFFDEESFGRGYGEESDFSMRVNDIGWKNMLCAEVFVYHQGGVSFSAETKKLQADAENVISQKFPSYRGKTTVFINEDPLRQYRDRIDMARLQRSEDDARQVLLEAKQYRNILTEKVDVYRHEYELSVAERDVSIAEYRAQRDNYASLLSDVQIKEREYIKLIAEQNEELEHNALVIADQNEVLEHNALVIADQNEVLEDIKSHLVTSEKELTGIQSSRFWRYTAWVRKFFSKF